MNTKETSGYLNFLRGIEPLNFDPELVEDSLDCFQSYSARTQAADEMATFSEDVPDTGERLRLLGVIGSPTVNFPADDDDEDPEAEPAPFSEPHSKARNRAVEGKSVAI